MDDTVTTEQPTPQVPTKLSEADKLRIDLAKEWMDSAKARAETAEMQYRYLILKLYYSYGLTDNDVLSTDGDIVINGKNQVAQQK